MISFESDYTEGAHPKILQRLMETNLEQLSGYGGDKYCDSAREKIRKACGQPEAAVWFISGGTQTNQLVISSLLRSYEGVIAAQTGHVNGHEAGAIEYTGHKVLALPHTEGRLTAESVRECLEGFYGDRNHEHMVFPGMVYISHPTEYGTLYSKAELEALHEVCAAYRIPLYMDGARLAYGLMSRETDVTLMDIAELCDVFYIGGTKCGALLGEAVVFPKGGAPEHFLTLIKQHGALLAKGRAMGVQFDTLFTDGLYDELGKNAIDRAEDMKRVLRKKGCRFFMNSPTNQQFIVLEDGQLAELQKKIAVSFWEKPDAEHTVVRLATSWATTEEQIRALGEALGEVYGNVD